MYRKSGKVSSVRVLESGYMSIFRDVTVYHTHASSSSAITISLEGLFLDTARGRGQLVTLQ